MQVRLCAFCAVLSLLAGPAAAYVGPGLGIGVVMTVLTIFASVLIAVLAIFWYPLKRFFKRRKPAVEDEATDTSSRQGDG